MRLDLHCALTMSPPPDGRGLKRRLNHELNDDLRAYIERRLDSALGRFADRIARVEVRLADDNGPRGETNKRCQVIISLVRGGQLIVEGNDSNPYALASQAARRAGRALRRHLDRRRVRAMA